MRISSIVIGALCLLLAGAAGAESKPAPDARAQVETLLRAYHALPDRAAFEEAGAPDPAGLLRAIATDPKTFGPIRAAAYQALRWWPDDATFALYAEAARPGNAAGLRHKVLRSLAIFGDRALPDLGRAMADADPQIRLTAAHAVNDIAGQQAAKLLGQAAAAESAPWVRGQIEALIARRNSIR